VAKITAWYGDQLFANLPVMVLVICHARPRFIMDVLGMLKPMLESAADKPLLIRKRKLAELIDWHRKCSRFIHRGCT
jgi:hypothetical protein